MNSMNKRYISSIAFLCIPIILSGCARTTAAELTPVTIQLQWIHQAQFAGLYAADQNGYYAEEGLKVMFTEGGAEVDRFTPVLDGTAHFSMATTDELILAQAGGKRPTPKPGTDQRHSCFHNGCHHYD